MFPGKFGGGMNALVKFTATGSSRLAGTMLLTNGVPVGLDALTELGGATVIRFPRTKLREKSPVRSSAVGTMIVELVVPSTCRVTSVLRKKKVRSLPL